MVGSRIKNLRIEKGLLQKDLANILNLTQQTISLYESNSRQPDYETLIKFANFFGVSVDYLLGVTEIRNSNDSNTIIKDINSLNQESKKDLERYIQLLKLREEMDKSKDESSSASQEQA